MKKTDDVIDVDSTEDMLKGKAPRRLLWVFMGIFMAFILAMSMFIIATNEKEVPKQVVAKQITDQVKRDSTTGDKIVDNAQATQTGASLETVKQLASSGPTGELNKLSSATSVISNGSKPVPSLPVDSATHPLASEMRSNEAVQASPLFKGGISRTNGNSEMKISGQTALDEEISQLNGLRARQKNAADSQLDILKSAMMQQHGEPKKSNADKEVAFNESIASKLGNVPSGIIEKSKSKCLLRPGWIIPVANIEKMNSDMPGEVTLMVRENVYGSFDNSCLAIPSGSTIIITYNPNVIVGQERFNAAATMMHLPNGKRVPMMGSNIYEKDGSAGIEADVNNHFVKMLGTSLMLGFIAKFTGDDKVATNSQNGSTTTNSTALTKILGETAETVLSRNKNIQPTLTRDQATRFNLKVSREFFMENYRD